MDLDTVGHIWNQKDTNSIHRDKIFKSLLRCFCYGNLVLAMIMVDTNKITNV